MPVVTPPIKIVMPKIPVELPDVTMPRWKWVKPKTWVQEPVRIHIKFPLRPQTEIELPLIIEIPGVGSFEVKLDLQATAESAQSAT